MMPMKKENIHKALLKKTLVLLIALGLLLCTPLSAQITEPQNQQASDTKVSSDDNNLTGQKVMQTFDFEERQVNYLDLPMFWTKVVGLEGFPHYSTGKLDTEHRRSGRYSFKLIPDGGSVAFEYDKRRILIKVGSDFQINGYVHLEQARTCRAQLVCALTDRRGKIIPGSEHYSELIGPKDLGPDGWALLEVYVPGNFSEAQHMTMKVQLLQERQWNQNALATSGILRSDVKAVAWFDDITIYQLPRVILRTENSGNVFPGSETAVLQVELNGVSSLDYRGHLTVRNAADNIVHDEAWVLSGVEGTTRIKNIQLPRLLAGLYRAQLDIIAAGALIAKRHLTFLKLARLTGEITGSGKGFGLILLENQHADWDTIATLSHHTNAKLLKLPVWRRRPDIPGAILTEKNFDRKLMELQQSNIEPVATFSEVPNELAMKMTFGNRSLLDILSLDAKVWRPQVAHVLAQYANQIPFWQIGADNLSEDQSWDPRIRPVVDKMQKEFDKLVRNIILTVPLNSMFQINRSQVGTGHVALFIPAAVSVNQIPAYLEDSRHRGLENIWVTIETLDPQQYSRELRLIDFAKRIAFAKKGLAQAVFIKPPWSHHEYNARLVTEPDEYFLIFRTLSDHLGSAKYIGQFELAPDIHAIIFESHGTGSIFAWNDNYNPQDDTQKPNVELFLGENCHEVDLFGNAEKLPINNGRTQLHITSRPIIITGINSRIAYLRANLKLNPAVLEASIARENLMLEFVNPFGSPVSGRLRFVLNHPGKKNWIVDPSSFGFFLNPYETFRRPLTLKLPRNELAGKKELDVHIIIDADRSYSIKSVVPFEIRLTEVDVSIFARRLNDSDMLIQLVVTNLSASELNLRSFVDLPDSDRLERVISNFQPGMTVTKSFFVPEATQWLGKYLRIGLYDPKGTKRINYRIKIN